jgi:hypothetical protein
MAYLAFLRCEASYASLLITACRERRKHSKRALSRGPKQTLTFQ